MNYPAQSAIAAVLQSIGENKKKKAMEDTLDRARAKGYDIEIEIDPATGQAKYNLKYKSKKDYKDLLTEKWRTNPSSMTKEELKFIGAYVKSEEEDEDSPWKKKIPPDGNDKTNKGFDLSNLFKIFSNKASSAVSDVSGGMQNVSGGNIFGDILGAGKSALQNIQNRMPSRMTPRYSQSDAKAMLWLKQNRAPVTPANIKATKQKFGWVE